MIGFEMTATSNIGFDNRVSKSQEGDSWLLKKMLSPFAPKGAEMFTPDMLGAVDSQFVNLRNILVNQIGGITNSFYVLITGDFKATIKFLPETPANIQIWRFLHNINLNAEEMGVHVMKALCETILVFDDYVTVNYVFGGKGLPVLTVDIKL